MLASTGRLAYTNVSTTMPGCIGGGGDGLGASGCGGEEGGNWTPHDPPCVTAELESWTSDASDVHPTLHRTDTASGIGHVNELVCAVSVIPPRLQDDDVASAREAGTVPLSRFQNS